MASPITGLHVTSDQSSRCEALWYTGPGRAELRAGSVAPPTPNALQVRALFSGISRGSERLVFNGRVPESEYRRMRAPLMEGGFPFPVKYGYASVGRIEAGPASLVGRTVFALHPHQTLFNLPAEAAFFVPDDVPPKRAVLAANMETALNALWDGAPGPADRIAVVGGGVVGLLVAYLCSRLPGAHVTVVDVAPARADIARMLGARFATPDQAPAECDLVFHASGSAAGLATALRLAGEEATVVELSWYGAGDVAVPLGDVFHSRRLRLVASQVGRVAPSHRSRWTTGRRLQAALSLLADPALDALLAPPVPFEQLPEKLPGLFEPDADARVPVVQYPLA
jgi:NADPH:quinone reductase-like Zn-dependent oxidoreductase